MTALACTIYGFTPLGQMQRDKLYGFAGFLDHRYGFLVTAALLVHGAIAGLLPCRAQSAILEVVALLSGRRGGSPCSPSTEWTKGLRRIALPCSSRCSRLFCTADGHVADGLYGRGHPRRGDCGRGGIRRRIQNARRQDQHGFWFLIQLILFVDVPIFTVGYLVELPQPGQRDPFRRSNPDGFRSGADLLSAVQHRHERRVLGSPVSDFLRIGQPQAHISLNLAR